MPRLAKNTTYHFSGCLLGFAICTATWLHFLIPAKVIAKPIAIQEDVTSATTADITSELAELKVIAQQLLDDPKQINQYRPSWAQVQELATDITDAASLYCDSQATFKSYARNGLPLQSGSTEASVKERRVTEFCNEEIAKRLSQTRLYEVAFSQPDSNTELSFVGFAKVDGNWAFFPKPWKAIESAKDKNIHPGTFFLDMLHGELYVDAYEYSAPVIREVMTLQQFMTYVSSLNMPQVRTIDWKRTTNNRRNSEVVRIFEGQLRYRDDTKARITLTLKEFEGDSPRPFRIEVTRQFGAMDSYALTPPLEECKSVARGSVRKLIDAIQNDGFKQFREESASFELQQSASVETFQNTFQSFNETDLSFVKDSKLNFSKRPLYSEEHKGCIALEGSFRNPEQGKVLAFTLKASEDFGKWKLNGIYLYPVRSFDPKVEAPVMSGDALLALASQTTKTFTRAMASGDFTELHNQFTDEQKALTNAVKLKESFFALAELFEDQGLFASEDELDVQLRIAPSIDGDHVKVSVSLTEPSGEWIQGDLEYLFVEGSWRVLRLSYRY